MPQMPKTSERKNLSPAQTVLSRSARFALGVFEQIAHDAEVFYVATTSRRNTIYQPVGLAAAERIVAAEKRKREREVLLRLRRREFIACRRENGRLIDVLTEKGSNLYLKLRLKAAPSSQDGTTTFVSYDIPETAREARDAFRCMLKSACFTMTHRSFWIIKKDVAALLRQWVRKHRIGKWVVVRLERP